jgi:hypothetical protein
MSLSITQTPATVSPAQSPIAVTLYENTDVVYSSSFQYYLDLYYWTGSAAGSSTVPDYTLVKYPNPSKVGIFDLSKILNSTLQDLRQTNPSNVKFYKVDGYYRYLSGSIYVTGSHTQSSTYKIIDGYGIFQEAINGPVYSKSPYWPIMSDGPVTQSFFEDNTGTLGVYVQNAGTTTPTKITYVSNLGTANINLSGSTATTGQIQQPPLFPAQTGFPFSPSGLEWYTVQPFNGSSALAPTIRFEYACKQKYPNVRIKWKNRYGQFDYFNFYMVSKKSFKTEKRTYQPQIGTWQGTSLAYNNYDSQNLNYLVDSQQGISVNTFWIPEDYNDILKQLMVSDEIYYVTTESSDALTPITIDTDSVTFKTKSVDKLIQYSFDFRFGQGYKLII